MWLLRAVIIFQKATESSPSDCNFKGKTNYILVSFPGKTWGCLFYLQGCKKSGLLKISLFFVSLDKLFYKI